MNDKISLNELVLNVFLCLTPKQRLRFKGIILLMLLSSMAEIMSLGAIIPFLTAMTKPDDILNYKEISGLLLALDIENKNELVFWVAVLFAIAALLSGALRYVLLHSITRTSFTAGAEVGNLIFRNLVYSNYSYHIVTNSSNHIDVVTSKVNIVIFNVIVPTMIIISSIIIIASIAGFLFFINPLITAVSICFFLGVYIIISIFARKKLSEDATIISEKSTYLIKELQESLASIRDIIIDSSQEKVIRSFSLTNNSLRKSQGNNQIRSQSPRYLVESIGLVFIAFVTYFLTTKNNDVSAVIPILGALALSSQKLLPLAQSIFNSYANIQGSRASIIEVLKMVNLKPTLSKFNDSKIKMLTLNESIILSNVSFQYIDNNKLVLNKVNLKVNKGDKIGIIGSTGSGKSTLIDVILGLLPPTSGVISIDGMIINKSDISSWQKNIAHVPQNISLIDSTLAENISYSESSGEIDGDLLQYSAECAVLKTYINSLEFGYLTQVGEKGIQLSGGQRQRIGIARAIYKQADVMILDEATSALDYETEEIVINKITETTKNLTVIMIAHRTTTLRFCNKIYQLQNGSLDFIGDYNRLCSIQS